MREGGDVIRTITGALATLNRSIPLADELADGVAALEEIRAGRARGLGQAWNQARAKSGAAAGAFAREHPTAAALTRGAGLAVQAVPFMGAAAPAAGSGLARRAAEAAVIGGGGAQVGGLAGEGTLQDRAGAANQATPAAMATGAVLPAAADLVGLMRRARQARPLVELTGEEVAPIGASAEDLREAYNAFYDAQLRGHSVRDPDGDLVDFVRAGRDKSRSYSAASPDKLRAGPALPEVIGSGRVTDKSPPHKPVRADVQGFKTIEGPIALGGETRPMRVKVRQTIDGAHHYDHTLGPPPMADSGTLDRLLRLLAGAQGVSLGSGSE